MLVNRLGAAILAGEHDVVLVGGVECMYSRRRARRIDPKAWLDWTQADDPPCPNVVGDARPGIEPVRDGPPRARADAGVPAVRDRDPPRRRATPSTRTSARSASLWSHLAAVAARNPYAWSPTAYTPDEIREPSADNRMACFPYTKRMCANLDVDQAAAFVLCSYEAAVAAGVAPDRMVFPHAGADAHDHYFVTERASLGASTAIGIAGRAALDAAGLALDDVARFDLYSCFPSAVQLALASLGLAGTDRRRRPPDHRDRRAAVRGRPGQQLRRPLDRGDGRGLPAGSGLASGSSPRSAGTPPSTASASTRREPPPAGFRAVDPAETQRAVDAGPRREPAGLVDGDGTVEATSVAFDRDGTPTIGILSVLLPDGRRALRQLHRRRHQPRDVRRRVGGSHGRRCAPTATPTCSST